MGIHNTKACTWLHLLWLVKSLQDQNQPRALAAPALLQHSKLWELVNFGKHYISNLEKSSAWMIRAGYKGQ